MLIDNFGRIHDYLRISLTDRCNLRCRYCMPEDGVNLQDKSNILSFEEIIRVAEIAVKLGITKIRLTGGEPLVRQDVEVLIRRLKQINGLENIAMTSNGVLLKNKATKLYEAGLDKINISLDSLDRDTFMRISRRDNLQDVLAGIEEALSIPKWLPLRLNTVIMRGINDRQMPEFIEFIKDKPVNVRFIEYMPFEGNGYDTDTFVSYMEMLETLSERYRITPIPAKDKGFTKDYAVNGYMGTISFITSMSDNFCSTCSRIRFTAEGALKGCLFGGKNEEVHIRDILRENSDENKIIEAFKKVMTAKKERHPPMQELLTIGNRSMIQIGG